MTTSNRLARESSPYLLQHRKNPVDWYPWGEEALARSRRENKPILLSIGYSACHWCHVMAHESFENTEIARIMNENFVNIKVDREERPDLDHIYQNVAQAITRGGGWPLTVFLTPELKPFYGGTYFPPEDKWGRPGFPKVLLALSQAFHSDQENVAENARRLTEFIAAVETVSPGPASAPTAKGLKSAVESMLSGIDWQNGGIGGAPKFPNVMVFDFLWRYSQATSDVRSREAVLLTLRKMAEGGIYDQLGGGFSRYSVDGTWSVPHFEKMLYDNGLLLKLYSQVLLGELDASDRELFTRVVRDTVTYLLREMRAPGGGFYAAQDADSEGEEGKFFVWDHESLAPILTADEARVFEKRFGVTVAGNFEHGKTVLYLAAEAPPEERAMLQSAMHKVFSARAKRNPPATDTKVLASWNGLLISGLAWAHRALGDEGARNAALEAFEFVESRMTRAEGRLYGTFQFDGQAGAPKLNAYLDDYAFLTMAALDLARFEKNPERLERQITRAKEWSTAVLKHFSDPGQPGYFFTSDDHEALIHRPKTTQDQAIPSGVAVILECFQALSELGAGDLRMEIERQIPQLWPAAQSSPFGFGAALCAMLLELQGPVVVTGPPELVDSPSVFRKPGDTITLCHRGTCSLPYDDPSMIRQEIVRQLRLAN
ncbi:MAG: thioredoxin domain-containing protein [Bdellovibrionota bacterium]